MPPPLEHALRQVVEPKTYTGDEVQLGSTFEAISRTGDSSPTSYNNTSHGVAYTIHADPTPKISAGVTGTLRSQGGGGIVPPSVVYEVGGKPQAIDVSEEPPLVSVPRGHKGSLGVIAGNVIGRPPANGSQLGIYESETVPTLTRGPRHAVIYYYVVRRLTPIECERLMGFPDNYTHVPHKGKPASNTARYKALGNSMAVPVVQYVGQQIQSVVNFNQSKQE